MGVYCWNIVGSRLTSFLKTFKSDKMPTYKYEYFNGRGRGEISRLLFAVSGQKFEDARIEGKDWPKRKESSKLGTLPILTTDGKEIYQSQAIVRHLARVFDLYGKSDSEKSTVDIVLECCTDIREGLFKAMFEKDEAKKAEMMKESPPKWMPSMKLFEEMYSKNKGGFIAGSKITVADLAIYDLLQNIEPLLPEGEKKLIPNVLGNKKAVEGDKGVKAYLAKRPKTDF